jgi:hypothetical protein
MAFKKSAQKNKKKSKKKSSSDREWSHEGGQNFATKTDTGDDEKKKHVRRRTQDRDERQRRGRSKIEIRKEKQAFVRKMSKKISFNEILGLDEVEEEKEEPSKKRRIEANPVKSTSQVYKKIKKFFVEPTVDAIESGSELGEDENENEEGVEDDKEDLEDYEYDDESEVGEIETRVGIILQDVSGADPISEVTPPAGVANWFFSSKDEDNTSLDKTSTIKLNDLELGTTLTATVSGKMNPKISPFPITKVGDIPELHSMWAHLYGNNFASPIEPTLLSYLSCYTDLFIEGRDEQNDKEILYGTLWHILGHVVNSR